MRAIYLIGAIILLWAFAFFLWDVMSDFIEDEEYEQEKENNPYL